MPREPLTEGVVCPVVMPQMGESIAEGIVTRWLVKVGAPVTRDQPLFEISTDKVDAEIPSPAGGLLLETLHGEGDTVPVNEVVARILVGRLAVMPQMGASIHEGTITKWLAEPGAIVTRDQPLFEISTDKVDAEIPSLCDGVLLRLLHPESSTVPVDTAVALLLPLLKVEAPARAAYGWGAVAQWFEREKAAIQRGQPLVQLVRSDANGPAIRLDSPAAGILYSIARKAGQAVEGGQTLAWIAPLEDYILNAVRAEASDPAGVPRPPQVDDSPGSRPAEVQAARAAAATSDGSLRVFLCHSSQDKPTVRDLYWRLREEGFDPWLDEEDLLPGQNWQIEIPRILRSSHAVVVCLSNSAVTKAGFVQREIKSALDTLEEQPEETLFLIPIKLEECRIPKGLSHLHCVHVVDGKGYEKLVRALKARAAQLGLKIG